MTLPPKKKTFQSRHGHSGEEPDLKLSGFGILPSTYNLYISDFFNTGDLRSGKFREALTPNQILCSDPMVLISFCMMFKILFENGPHECI